VSGSTLHQLTQIDRTQRISLLFPPLLCLADTLEKGIYF
jgi:hypothetical protein